MDYYTDMKNNCNAYFHPLNSKFFNNQIADAAVKFGIIISMFTFIIPGIVWGIEKYAEYKLKGRAAPINIDEIPDDSLPSKANDVAKMQLVYNNNPPRAQYAPPKLVYHEGISAEEAAASAPRLAVGEKTDKDIVAVVIGPSRGGKSTALKVVSEGSTYVTPKKSIFMGTAHLEHSIIPFGGHYLHWLDTPGLFEDAKIGNTKRTNSELVDEITVITNSAFGGFKNMNVVIMTIKLNDNSLDSQSVRALSEFAEQLKEIDAINAERAKNGQEGIKKILLLTYAECLVSEDRKAILTKVEEQIKNVSFDEILFSGALQQEEVDREDEIDPEAVKRKVETVQQYREALITALLPRGVEFEKEHLPDTLFESEHNIYTALNQKK